MMIHVTANSNRDLQTAFETPLVQDISRFKDTGQILAASQSSDYDPTTMRFVITVVVTEVRMSARSTGYAAMYFFIEECAVFSNAVGYGVTTVQASGISLNSSKDDLINDLEKSIYDDVMKVVRKRRAR